MLNNYCAVILQKSQYSPEVSEYRLGQIRDEDLPLDLFLPNGRGLAFVFHFDYHTSENLNSYNSSSNKFCVCFPSLWTTNDAMILLLYTPHANVHYILHLLLHYTDSRKGKILFMSVTV